MNRPFTLYLDETGNRHPDKKPDITREGRDWFAFGGILVRGEDNDAARSLVDSFAEKWKLRGPAHLTDMRSEKKAFSWLERTTQVKRDEFWGDWKNVLTDAPVIGMGCVIDRPGYVGRGYLQKHGNNRWLLCRSAFDITVKRAAKIAMKEDRKLHVVFESDPSFNKTVVGYFENLKQNGLAFDQGTSGKYEPMSKENFANVLGRIQYKPKSFPLLQIADSFIYAIARAGYDKKFDLYRHIRDRARISDLAFPSENRNVGVKYYCFD
ncbi:MULTISPECIES: DUF3800 domain-containing protein [Methylobacterium]|jgi:hypothetical protein|uniref:DUF3800 domain-containing protein n=1 Tax=Methylobacterium TaxID=407 RepID=UPI0008E72EE1|nr:MULTISPECIES: DUF3800 domain-containing protein [Methylobacterium]MBZ6415993.1 DUF3800 domain-containing protein [Methylobacterium sp.]MBK3399395.1 DUF3800 domain-containing protein [Methylobacterium ajmalii]MBK3412568.1 DUF3800 domain-containing protein [Methylobacterium ajmalii]MBK3420431.1 DUF3800 domain-containing protein [Methylobacterium ajmalii]SFF63958.1 Protein of unknown function [Methylobacterium sp. yr596]